MEKYILTIWAAATCVIMQKNGAGIHSANSCYWDTVTDGKN